jgi:hypothetical protein
VIVAAEDFTVQAGTISQAANSKRYRAAEIAYLRYALHRRQAPAEPVARIGIVP